jgi:hypothetical protein
MSSISKVKGQSAATKVMVAGVDVIDGVSEVSAGSLY